MQELHPLVDPTESAGAVLSAKLKVQERGVVLQGEQAPIQGTQHHENTIHPYTRYLYRLYSWCLRPWVLCALRTVSRMGTDSGSSPGASAGAWVASVSTPSMAAMLLILTELHHAERALKFFGN